MFVKFNDFLELYFIWFLVKKVCKFIVFSLIVWFKWFLFWIVGMILILEVFVIKVNVCVIVWIDFLKLGFFIKLIMLVEFKL